MKITLRLKPIFQMIFGAVLVAVLPFSLGADDLLSEHVLSNKQGISNKHASTGSRLAAMPVLTREQLIDISSQISRAYQAKDFKTATQYYYAGSEFHLNLEPNQSTTWQDLSYQDYLALVKNSLNLQDTTELSNKIVSIDIADDGQSAVVVSEQATITTLYGLRWRDISISEMTFAYVAGELKIVRLDGQRLSHQRI